MIIRKLKLLSFGKFKNTEFDFAPLTVFLGKNESGKSTLFDAIFDRISSPKGNSTEGRRLISRYGADRNTEIIWEHKASIPPDEFINLYAIGSGSVNIDFSSGSEWVNKVKASIFSGGLDPGSIAQDFDRMASNSSRYMHVKELRKKEAELAETKQMLEILEKKKAEILSEEKNIEALEKQLGIIEIEIANLEKSVADTEEKIHQQELHRKLEDIRSTFERLVKFERVRQQKSELSIYGGDMSDKIRNAQFELEEAKIRAGELSRQQELLENRKKDVLARLADIRIKSEKMQKKSSLASELLRRIEAESPKEIIKIETQWRSASLIVILITLVLGIALFMYNYPSYFAAVSLIGAIVTSLILSLFARKKTEVREKPDTGRLCAALKDEWKIRTGEELISSTLEGLHRELVRLQSDADSLEKEKESFAQEETDLAVKIAGSEHERRKAEESYQESRNRLEELFKTLKIGTSEEYAARRAEFENNMQIYNDLALKIENDKKRYNAKSVEELKAVCQLQQSNLEKECVMERISEVEINRLKNELEHNKNELSAKRAKYIEIKSVFERGKGELRGHLGELPQNIFERMKKIASLEREINRMRLDMEAAGIARDIFLEISKYSDIVFSELSDCIRSFLSDMIEGERNIDFKDFSTSSIMLTDAAGEPRTIENLSTGTRDAFILATRFSFALRSWKENFPGIIVFDEPFHSLDDERLKKTVGLIKRFHDEKKWQVVVFTKDRGLAEELARASDSSKLHVLEH